MTADQLRECREDFMEWFRTTSPQTLDFTLQSTIREFAYQAWKDATIKANTRPTAVASHAEGEVVADDPKTDREALIYLMRAFDTESWQCPRCGHDEDCATMDSAYFLRDYLRAHPPRSGDEALKVPDGYLLVRDPIHWGQEENKAWHRAIPSVRNAFIALANVTPKPAAMAARGEK